MAVAHDASSESHTGTTGSVSEATYSWTHTPVGTPKGVIVFAYVIDAVDQVTGVTYGGTAMSAVSGGNAVDTANEVGRCKAYFLGSSVPTGAQTVEVTRTNGVSTHYATCSTVTASGDTEVYTSGIVLLQGDQTLAEQNVDDGSPGTNSLRFSGLYSGHTNPGAVGANSTLAHQIDLGSFSCNTCYETTAGQGSRPIGWTNGVSDDVAAVHLAIREVAVGGGGSASGNLLLLGCG